ncbi:TPA: MmcQ/YjbR family DNA-binding protein [Enterococcus faecium]
MLTKKELIDHINETYNLSPAYHMNKEHWISIDLRKIEKLDELADLIDGSFKSTQ